MEKWAGEKNHRIECSGEVNEKQIVEKRYKNKNKVYKTNQLLSVVVVVV